MADRTERAALLESAMVARFGEQWRKGPLVTDARLVDEALDDLGWNTVRDTFDGIVADAALNHLDPTLLAAAVAELLAPAGSDVDPLQPRLEQLTTGMIAAGSGPQEAALDAVLTVVMSGDHALADTVDAGLPNLVAAQWIEATRMSEAVVARKLASAGRRLSRQVGAGVLGELPAVSGTGSESFKRYSAAATEYVRWQQGQRCHCHRDCGQGTDKHQLHRWAPNGDVNARGARKHALNLAEWVRTWLIGAQPGDDHHRTGVSVALLSKALEGGVFYRHFLRTIGDAVFTIEIGNVLPEGCTRDCTTTRGRAVQITRARRVSSREPGFDRSRYGQRVCPNDVEHPIAFNLEDCPREIVLLGRDRTSHRLYSRLDWDGAASRWRFRTGPGKGSTRWLPLPHGDAWDDLSGRALADDPVWEEPALPWPDRLRRYRDDDDRDAGRDADHASQTQALDRTDGAPTGGIDDLSLDVRRLVVEAMGRGKAGFLEELEDILLPTGLVDVDPRCPCCAGHERASSCRTKVASYGLEVHEWLERS